MDIEMVLYEKFESMPNGFTPMLQTEILRRTEAVKIRSRWKRQLRTATLGFASAIAFVFIVISGIVYLNSHAKTTTSSMLSHVPSSDLKTLRQSARDVPFTFKRPSWLPFLVNGVNTQVMPLGVQSKQVSITYLSKDKAYVTETATDAHVSIGSVTGETMVTLHNGTRAIFGRNHNVSQLYWNEGNVNYSLESGKVSNGNTVPNLSGQQMVRVADSFQ